MDLYGLLRDVGKGLGFLLHIGGLLSIPWSNSPLVAAVGSVSGGVLLLYCKAVEIQETINSTD